MLASVRRLIRLLGSGASVEFRASVGAEDLRRGLAASVRPAMLGAFEIHMPVPEEMTGLRGRLNGERVLAGIPGALLRRRSELPRPCRI